MIVLCVLRCSPGQSSSWRVLQPQKGSVPVTVRPLALHTMETQTLFLQYCTPNTPMAQLSQFLVPGLTGTLKLASNDPLSLLLSVLWMLQSIQVWAW